jgi:hypothetical protein
MKSRLMAALKNPWSWCFGCYAGVIALGVLALSRPGLTVNVALFPVCCVVASGILSAWLGLLLRPDATDGSWIVVAGVLTPPLFVACLFGGIELYALWLYGPAQYDFRRDFRGVPEIMMMYMIWYAYGFSVIGTVTFLPIFYIAGIALAECKRKRSG